MYHFPSRLPLPGESYSVRIVLLRDHCAIVGWNVDKAFRYHASISSWYRFLGQNIFVISPLRQVSCPCRTISPVGESREDFCIGCWANKAEQLTLYWCCAVNVHKSYTARGRGEKEDCVQIYH